MTYYDVLMNDAGSTTSLTAAVPFKVMDETTSTHRKVNNAGTFLIKVAGAATMSALTLVGNATGTPTNVDQYSNIVNEHSQVSAYNTISSILTTELSSGSVESSLVIQDLTSFIRNHIDLPFADQLVSRIEELHTLCLIEGPEQDPMSVFSLAGLIDFLQSSNDIVEPGVVVSYTGNICVEWYKSSREQVSVEFLPNGQVGYVSCAIDPDYPSRTDRISGVISAKSLLKKLEPFNVLSFMTV